MYDFKGGSEVIAFEFSDPNEKCPTNIYLFNVNNRNTTKRCEICSKLTIKTPERRHSLLVATLDSYGL